MAIRVGLAHLEQLLFSVKGHDLGPNDCRAGVEGHDIAHYGLVLALLCDHASYLDHRVLLSLGKVPLNMQTLP